MKYPDSSKPCRRADLVFQPAGADMLVYDPAADIVHVLNHTALAIWEMCDGRHAAADIEAMLRARFAATERHDVAADVGAILNHFKAAGLLETANE